MMLRKWAAMMGLWMLLGWGITANCRSRDASEVPSHARKDILSALDGCRPQYGRISGQVSHTPFQEACKVVPPRGIWRRLGRLPKEGEPLQLGQAYADQGVMLLLGGDSSEAVKLIESAFGLSPKSPQAANDLAVAYVAHSSKTGNPYYLLLALGVLIQAEQMAPPMIEVRFNLALVLSQLQLRSQAVVAWRKLLREERDSAWRAEILDVLSDLQKDDRAREWREAQVTLWGCAARGDASRTVSIVRRFSQEARTWVQQDLLERWALAHLEERGADADVALRVARAIGDALVLVNGERSVADAVSVIEEVSGSIRDRAAEGHVAYAEGVRSHEALKIEQAIVSFDQAIQSLAAVSSPAALWSKYWLATASYYQGHHARCLDLLRSFPLPALESYPALKGRIKWSLGLLSMMHMDLGSALIEYLQARELFARLGEYENIGAVEYLIAENYQLLGEIESAWIHRGRALKKLSDSGASVRLNNLLLEASKALLQEGRVREALYFQEEELVVAHKIARPVTLVESLLLRGRLLAMLGLGSDAKRSLMEAKAHAQGASDHFIRERLRAEIRLAECELIMGDSPGKTLALLSSVIDFYSRNHLSYNLVRAYSLRAQAYRILGRTKEAEDDVNAGIKLYESTSEGLRGEPHFSAYTEQWQEVFDEAIRLKVEQGKSAEAWALLGRAKNMELPAAEFAGMSLDRFQAALDQETVVVEYAILPDQLLIWCIWSGGADLLVVRIHEGSLRDQIQWLRYALKRKLPQDSWLNTSCDLFDLLIRPALSRGPAGARIIIIPDKFLRSVPFSVLSEREEQRFLIEMRAVQLSFDAQSYIKIRSRSNVLNLRYASFLGVGVAGGRRAGDDAGETMADLPGVEEELIRIAKLYENADLFLDASVAKDRILESMNNYDIVHFAGHATAAGEGLSRLVLGGGAGHDLFAYEVVDSCLDRVSLVVLSACTTGLGAGDRRGETGMASAFQRAGVPAVVATLWDVEDGISQSLSVYFHRYLVAGMGGGEALRKAQLDMLGDRSSTYSHPSNWAAFEFVGDLIVRR